MTFSEPRDIILEELNRRAVIAATKVNERIGDAPRFTWNFRQKDIVRKIIEEGGLDNFLNWPVSAEALYAGVTHKTIQEYGLLPQRYRHMAADPRFPPAPGRLTPEGASGTYIRQMFLAYMFEKHASRSWWNVESVYEVGGGYGAMRVILRRLGFAGKYTVLDLPALHIVRNWYLYNAGILCDWEEDIAADRDVDVMIASHSLCEMSIHRREEILSRVSARYYLISFSKYWDGIDNSGWFREWANRNDIVLHWFHENDAQEMLVGKRP